MKKAAIAPQRRPHWMMAIWLCLALVMAPAHANAATPAARLAQTTLYEDPDGRFSLPVPEEFSDSADVTYEMIGENSLDGLLASSGRAFGTPETNNSMAVLFLLLDQPITGETDFAAFLANFQTAAGGATLPLIDLDFLPGDELRAGGSITTRERFLQVELHAEGDVAAVLSAGVDRSQRSQLRAAIDAVFADFTWSPELVRASLGATPEPEPAQPAETEETQELQVVEPASPGADDMESQHYQDPQNAFSLAVPAGLSTQPETQEGPGSIVYGFFSPDNEDEPVVAAGFISVAYAVEQDDSAPLFRSVSDEEWARFIDEFLLFDSTIEVLEDRRDAQLRTAYLHMHAPQNESAPYLWAWVEETDGVAAVLVASDIAGFSGADALHTALTSFNWSPPLAKATIAAVSGMPDPAGAPVPFEDPLGLISLMMPPDYPFQSVVFDDDTLEYSFGLNPIEGIVLVNMSAITDRPFAPEEWNEIVATVESGLVDTLAQSGLGRNPTLLPSELGRPDVGADNAALLRAASDLFQMAVVILDFGGILVTEVFILPDTYWQMSEEIVHEAIDAGVTLDAAAVRQAFDDYLGLGVTMLATTMSGDRPGPNQDPEPLYEFDPEGTISLAVHFAEPDLDGALTAQIFQDSLPDHPVAAFAIDLAGGPVNAYDTVILQDDQGTRAAFIFHTDFPLAVGSYAAHLFYEGVPVAAHRFAVKDNPPQQTELVNFGVYYGDVYSGEPILVTRAIHPQDVVHVRGTGDLPPNSNLRLFWYDPDGALVTDEVLTIRIAPSSHALFDWFVFETLIDWQPGAYSYVLTLNGETLAAGELRVVQEAAEVALTPDGGEVLAALPLPPDLASAPAEGFDLAVVPSAEFDGPAVISTVDAWLRMQGWQPALPPYGAPVSWEHRRWDKGGYQVALQPGPAGSDAEIRMTYTTTDDGAFGRLPAREPLTTDNLDMLSETAALEIPGLDVAEAELSPDGNWLAVTTTDGRLYFFDAHRLMDALWWTPALAFYANPTFSPDSSKLAVTVQSQNRSQIQVFHNFGVVWLPATLLGGYAGQVTGLTFQPNGLLASGDLEGGLRWWDVSGEQLPHLAAASGPVTSIASSPAGAPGLLVGLEGGEVEFRSEDGDLWWSGLGTLTELPQVAVWPALDAGGVGDLAVYGEGQAEWYAYDTSGADLIADLPEGDPNFASTGAAFSPDGSLMIIAGPYADFYGRADGASLGVRQTWITDDVPAQIERLIISDNGVYALLVTDDGLLRLWAAVQ